MNFMASIKSQETRNDLREKVNSKNPYHPVIVDIPDKGYLFIMKNCTPKKRVAIFFKGYTPEMRESAYALNKRLTESVSESRYFYQCYAGEPPKKVTNPDYTTKLVSQANIEGVLNDISEDTKQMRRTA